MPGSFWIPRSSHLRRWARVLPVEALASKAALHEVKGYRKLCTFSGVLTTDTHESEWSSGDDGAAGATAIPDNSLVDAQSKAIRNVLNDRDWDADMELRLCAFEKLFSPPLVARVLNQVGNVRTAQLFFGWVAKLDGYKHNNFVYNALILKLGSAMKFDAIEELLRKMQTEECPITGTTVALVIQSYGRAGRLQACWRYFYRSEGLGVKLDCRICTSLLSVLFNAGRVSSAKNLLSRMVERNLKPDLHIWFTVIQGLCKNNRVVDAIDRFGCMESSGFVPNSHIYNAIILGCCKAGLSKRALSYHKRMLLQGCEPDIFTWNAVIQAYCNLSRFSEAEVVVSRMKEAGCEPNAVTFNILLQNLAHQGNLEGMDSILNTMQEEGWADRTTYRVYCSHLKRMDNIDKLVSLAESLQSRYGQAEVEVCNAIIDYHCKKGNLDEASKYLNETSVKLSTPNSSSFVPILEAYCKSGDVDSARSLLSLMAQEGHLLADTHYDIVITGLCNHSWPVEAMKLFKEMSMKGLKSGSLACESLLMALSKAGMVVEASHLCHYIKLNRHSITELPIVSFVKCVNNLNRLEESKPLLREMMRTGCLPFSRRFLCCFGYLLQGEIDQVEKYFHKQMPNLIDFTMRIRSACRRGKLCKAMAALTEMKAVGLVPTPYCCEKLLFCLSKNKTTATESLNLFEELLNRDMVLGHALPSYLMDSFGKYELPLITRFCRLVIAKHLSIREGSAAVLLQEGVGSELKNLYLELKENNCLVEMVPTYSTPNCQVVRESWGVKADSL